MDTTPVVAQLQELQPKFHGLAVGATLGIGSMFLSQGCPLIGQCTACAACAPRLPLLALPFLVDGAVMLTRKIMERMGETAGDET
jgi:hypothetical protein